MVRWSEKKDNREQRLPDSKLFVPNIFSTDKVDQIPLVIAVDTRSDYREIRRSVYLITQQSVRLSRLHGILPEVTAILVGQLTDGSHGPVIADKLGILTVRTLERIHKVDEFIGSDVCCRCSGHTDFRTSLRSKQTKRLTYAGTVGQILHLPKRVPHPHQSILPQAW